MTARLRQAGRDLLYLLIAFATSCLALAVWITGLSTALSLAVFIVGIPAIVLIAELFRWTAELDRQNARVLRGAPIGARYRRAQGEGIWGRMRATLTDPQSLRDTAWLIVHSVVGVTFGFLALAVLGATIEVATMPIWWRWEWDDGVVVDWLGVDSTGKAALVALLAIPLAALSVLLLRAMASGHVRLADWFLRPRGEAVAADAPAVVAGRPGRAYRPEVGIAVHGSLVAFAGILLTVIWAFTGAGIWIVWVWFGLLVSLTTHLGIVRAVRAHDRGEALRAATEVVLLLIADCVLIWLLTGAGTFWPIWPAIGLLGALALTALVVLRPWSDGQLAERIETLTTTRRDALDAQATELRRIERDLHDGAQARLVALSMQLGRAEARLGDHREEAELIRQARGEAAAAIGELRDLARGIAPPVLVDRGLGAAVEALAVRSPVPVTVADRSGGRLPAAVENCAYFVCAEALTNVAKHAPGARAEIALTRAGDTLVVAIADHGDGGADAGGSGLTGLRQRVAALDGTLTITSASGQGTTIRAELPCGS